MPYFGQVLVKTHINMPVNVTFCSLIFLILDGFDRFRASFDRVYAFFACLNKAKPDLTIKP